ncbi:MAG TPA: DEAD/DEAH box helicase [Candidatus Elarobacter sp.]|nr:DEAD/DEAH box helicase [Candidatus Elarobacter sp.]
MTTTTTVETGSERANDGGSEFAALGLVPALVDAVAALGYEEATPIQRAAIPALLGGSDLLGQAATGTGKTAAFALPLLQRIAPYDEAKRVVRGLVVVPTRELAVQVAEAIHRYGHGLGARVAAIYGGAPIGAQIRALQRGVDVVVATPGRVLDHIERGTIVLGAVRFLVLDEADEMLDLGFADELEALLAAVPAERQTALFSATVAKRIATIAQRHLRNPVQATIARATGDAPWRVREVAYLVQRAFKPAALARVLDMEGAAGTIVFCRMRTEVDELTETLNARGYRAEPLHGGLSQEQRDRVLRRFRDEATDVLVATDVAARGLDIERVSHVVNFDVPSSPDAYIHRIGRTGRAGRDGVAISFVEGRERGLLANIERLTKRKIRIESVPTVHDLHERRLERTSELLREALASDDLDGYREVADALARDFPLLDVAAAAMKLATRGADGQTEEIEIPVARPSVPPPGVRGAVARLYIGLGRGAGVRPGDLVAAIVNEGGLPSNAIGAIQIADRFSLVEVPPDRIDDLVRRLRGKPMRPRRDRMSP